MAEETKNRQARRRKAAMLRQGFTEEQIGAGTPSQPLPHIRPEKLLRRPEVESRTGLSRSTIYAWMKSGEFPQPVALGARLVAWRESDIDAWLDALASEGAA